MCCGERYQLLGVVMFEKKERTYSQWGALMGLGMGTEMVYKIGYAVLVEGHKINHTKPL